MFAKIWCQNVQYDIGLFDDEKEAHNAYVAKSKELFGEFAYSGIDDVNVETTSQEDIESIASEECDTNHLNQCDENGHIEKVNDIPIEIDDFDDIPIEIDS